MDFAKEASGSRGQVLPVQYENRSATPSTPFFTIPSWWRRFIFQVFTPRELTVYVYICSIAGRDSLAFPTQSQIGQELGISSLDTIAKALRKIVNAGFLIRNTQQILNFQRTVYQRPAPEFTLIRLLEIKAITVDLYAATKVDRFEDELDTTKSAVELGLKNLLEDSFMRYREEPLALPGLLKSRFFKRTGHSYEEMWAALQHAEPSSP